MKTISFAVTYPTQWGCAKCGNLIRQNAYRVLVIVDGQEKILGADEDLSCSNCGDIKTGKTPALFDTKEEAEVRAQLIISKFTSRDQTFSINVLDYGVIRASSPELN